MSYISLFMLFTDVLLSVSLSQTQRANDIGHAKNHKLYLPWYLMFFSKDHLAEEMSCPFLSPNHVYLFTTKYVPTGVPITSYALYSLVCNFRNMLLVQRQRCVSYLCCRSSVKTSVHCNLKNAIQVKIVPVSVYFSQLQPMR